MNLQELIKELEKTTLKWSGKNIHQTQRNALKSEVADTLAEHLKVEGVRVERTLDGVAVGIPTERNKILWFTVDPIIKNADYDISEQVSAYGDVMEQRAEREAERLRKQAEREKSK